MKHQAWRHDPACYGPPQPVLARFADVDTRRHVNNIAVYGLHHEARQRWLMASAGAALWPEGRLRIKPLHSRTEFWRECHYPATVLAGVRLLAAASGGLTLAGALFQQGLCVGVQQAWLADWADDLATPRPLPTAWAHALAAQLPPPETAAEPADAAALPPMSPMPRGAGQRLHYAIEAAYATRYGDHDADGCSSEAAVVRGLEQARAALLQAAFAAAGGDSQRDWVRLLVARIDLHWAHHAPPPAAWTLAGAVSHTGRSSAVLRVALFDAAALQAMADCVMVYTDPAGPAGPAGPLPLPPRLQQALQALGWRHQHDAGAT